MTPSLLDINEIMKLLPHRYPFLLVDRVTEIVTGESIKAYKNVSVNEPFFQGHFPEAPVMPGVLMMEAMAQAGGIMVLHGFSPEERQGKLFMFTAIDGCKFRRPVYPGDRLDLHCQLLRQKFKIWRIKGEAFVDGKRVAEAELSAAITDSGVEA